MPEAHWNRALAWLLMGDYARGWPEYEWGVAAGARPLNERAYPTWLGESLPGKTLLVSAEQGLGDTLQFVRFLSAAKARVGKLVLECQPELLALLGQSGVADQILPSTTPESEMPEIAARVALMSLPGLLGVTLSRLPGPYPYLSAGQNSLRLITPFISAGDFKVGIVWAGSSSHQDDSNRSCDLHLFELLAQVPGVQLYCLQKGAHAQDIDQAGFSMVDLAPLLNDFTETAAGIAASGLAPSFAPSPPFSIEATEWSFSMMVSCFLSCMPVGCASFWIVLSCTWVGVPGLAVWHRLQFSTDHAVSPL
jgi:hypothetical protein